MYLSVSKPNHRSTRLSHEALVEWKLREMKTGPFGKPTMNQSGFMSSIVVQNKVNLKRTGNVGINSVKEFTKLYRSVPAMQLANDFAGFGV